MNEFILNNYKEGHLIGYQWDIKNPDKCICLIHGIGEYAGRYHRMAKIFNENNIAVFAMDLKGHGKSYGKKGHCAPRVDVLKDIDTLIEYIKDKHPTCEVVLYGHSMGGNIGLDYRYRGRYNGELAGYIISAPWIYLVKEVPRPLYKTVKALSKVIPKLTISSNIKETELGNVKYVKGYNDHPLTHSRVSLLCAAEGFDIGIAMAEGKQEIKGEGNTKPLLLMHGDEDSICALKGSEKIKENEGNLCQFITWQGLKHEIHNGGKKSEGDEVIAYAVKFTLGV
ncbi:MAG: alpha/beta fold hydrolase [Anaerovoracaceae bacterium]